MTDESTHTETPTRKTRLASSMRALTAHIEVIRDGINDTALEEDRDAARSALDKLHGNVTELLLAAHNAASAVEGLIGGDVDASGDAE